MRIYLHWELRDASTAIDFFSVVCSRVERSFSAKQQKKTRSIMEEEDLDIDQEKKLSATNIIVCVWMQKGLEVV